MPRKLTKSIAPQPAPPVPDAVMAHFLEAARLTLEAAWVCSDCSTVAVPGMSNPRMPVSEAMNALGSAVSAAADADGADAVVGFAMVCASLARKAAAMRQDGQMGAQLTGHPFFRAG